MAANPLLIQRPLITADDGTTRDRTVGGGGASIAPSFHTFLVVRPAALTVDACTVRPGRNFATAHQDIQRRVLMFAVTSPFPVSAGNGRNTDRGSPSARRSR
ncbi:hypothetical protein [Geodermatophilus chilensis]|uniref:hypothetical protein n=1 Tax=Geodermatophilus chilensis TaxID=2035835 RepID=UPI001E373D9F|nr:hypothetical protein [Geodermatophilus chilensis]